MIISLLNEKISIEKREVILDEIGNHKSIWSKFYKCYATISGESPSEESMESGILDTSKIDFTIRYCKKVSKIISTEYRVKFKENTYDIIGIDHMNYKKKSIKLRCKRSIYEG